MNSEHKQYDGEMLIGSECINSDQEYVQQLADSDVEQVAGGFIRGAAFGLKEGWKMGYQEAKAEGAGMVKRVTDGAKMGGALGTLGLVTSKPWLQALGTGAK